MNNIRATLQFIYGAMGSILLAALALPAAAIDLKNADGTWTFSLNGNVNVDYIWSSCQSATSAVTVDGGLTCTGTASGSNVSNIGNGLLPAAFVFGVATTQAGIDITGHLGLYPGIATNDGGSPNLQAGTGNGSSNTALGTTGLDVRQVYMTFGNKSMGTFTLGRQIGLFGADAILNDMTLPGVGAPGSAATAAPSNTTLGGIGFGYIYTDWLAQIDYTTPDFSGFSFTLGVFDPLNSLSEPADATVEPKKAPGFHAKGSFTLPFSDTSKLYVSVAYLTQQQYYDSTSLGTYNYTGNGVDVFAKLDLANLEVFGYYYHGTGLGTTALFLLGAYNGQTRDSDGYLAQATYKFGALKVGVQYGESKLDYANSADQAANPALVSSNKKGTLGLYYSLTDNLTLLAEGSDVKSKPHAGGENSATTVNVGAFFKF
ncbi:MAG TPA: porin [Steroidobacteraceae bacterium]|jgi:predicted porin|nr:porin [Steroidobacteraceae bacterium]